MALANTPAHRFVRAYLQEHRRPGLPRAESLRYHANLMREAWTLAHRRYGNPLTADETKYVKQWKQEADKRLARGYRERNDIVIAGSMGESTAYGLVLDAFAVRPVDYSENPLTATEQRRLASMVTDTEADRRAAESRGDQRGALLYQGRHYGYDDVQRQFAARPSYRNPMPCPACRSPVTVAANTVALDCPGCGATLGVR